MVLKFKPYFIHRQARKWISTLSALTPPHHFIIISRLFELFQSVPVLFPQDTDIPTARAAQTKELIMVYRFRATWFLVALWLVFSFSSVSASSIEENGREIMNLHEHAVIKVKLVLRFKIYMNGNEIKNNETKIEATGTVLDPSGLTIISLSMTDPGKFASLKLQSQMAPGKMDVESDLNEVIMILPNGTELPAKVILRDKDLDLAFVRPVEKPVQPIAAIDTRQTAQPQILDTVFILGRLGKVAGSVPSIVTDRIQAIMKKPRLFYVPQKSMDLGAPVFSRAGKWIGIILLRTIKTDDMSPGAMVVILPATDILDVTGQIPDKKDN